MKENEIKIKEYDYSSFNKLVGKSIKSLNIYMFKSTSGNYILDSLTDNESNEYEFKYTPAHANQYYMSCEIKPDRLKRFMKLNDQDNLVEAVDIHFSEEQAYCVHDYEYNIRIMIQTKKYKLMFESTIMYDYKDEKYYQWLEDIKSVSLETKENDAQKKQ